MSNEAAQQFYLAETAEGKFVAYTTRAPYFCFVANSEDAVIATARRAFTFADRINVGSHHEKSVSRTVTELRPIRVVSAEPELV